MDASIRGTHLRLLAISILLALGILVTGIWPSQPVYAQTAGGTDQTPPILTAMGEGEVRVAPDLAIVRLGVQTEAPTAAEAREQNAARAARIIDTLKSLGIPERDIRTSAFQIFPVRRFPDQTNQVGQPPIVAYQVTNIVTARTSRLDLVPSIIDRSVAAGANTVEGVDFTLQNEEPSRRSALTQAVENARANAETMARALRVTLVRVQSVQQGGAGVIPPPIMFRGAAVEQAAPATPVLPGQVTVNASVTLTYVIR